MSVTKIKFGNTEEFVPSKFKPDSKVEFVERCEYPVDRIKFKETTRGCSLELPLDNEEIFGFGLQLKSVKHRGKKRIIRSNADPLSDSGDSHAPVPFFVTNNGYGIVVDTARNVTFYCGYEFVQSHVKEEKNIATSTEELYSAKKTENAVLMIDIPVAKGINIYVIEGKSLMDIVMQYNMLSGGGCMPPIWGLGVLYRCYTKSDCNQVMGFADYFRTNKIPCDVIGLEPGWQTRAYSCSYKWDDEKFPNWQTMIKELSDDGFKINLWEHAFVNGQADFYDDIMSYSGNFEVWKGLVPDFSINETVKIFSEYHKKELVEKGITGFKMDECDGSDYTGGWSFPDCSEFPSGADGEQMHGMFGILYQKAILNSFDNTRIFSQVRNSGLFASSYPFVLYSDLYEHKDFIRGVVNSGYSGILWAPEIRHSVDKNDMVRRLQTAVFSHQVVLNQWNQEVAPWIKWDAVGEIREVLNIRMSLVPYIYSAYYDYYITGKPPIRSLCFDFENDSKCFDIDDEYMFGDSMLVAPMTAKQEERVVYLPKGKWYNFWTNEVYRGETEYTLKTNNIPVFVKENSIIPWAKPVEYIKQDMNFEIVIKCFGNLGEFNLIEDDGIYNNTEYKLSTLHFDDKNLKSFMQENSRYDIIGVEYI